MFKKILISTDGSSISIAASHAGVEFAKQIGAEIVGIYIAPEYNSPVNIGTLSTGYPSAEEYAVSMRQEGDSYFKGIKESAEASGLKFTGITILSDASAQQIARAAEENGCDMIFMGSHGRSGWGQLLLGSVTNKVLSLCQIPVLVYRTRKDPEE